MNTELLNAYKKLDAATAELIQHRNAVSELLRRWDALGKHKDDDFGEVGEWMEAVREVFKLHEPVSAGSVDSTG